MTADEAFPFHLCLALKRWGHPDQLYEELDNGQIGDWLQYHQQFNLEYDKPDVFSAMLISDFRNANKGDGSFDTRPIDLMPWKDPYGDDDAFVAAIHGFAASAQPQQVGA